MWRKRLMPTPPWFIIFSTQMATGSGETERLMRLSTTYTSVPSSASSTSIRFCTQKVSVGPEPKALIRKP